MADERFPNTATQLAGHATTAIVGGLTPAMLGVLLLNVIGIGAAIYFLNVLITGQQKHLGNLLDVQQAQITQVLGTHDREFDALMEMVRQAYKDQVIRLTPPKEEPPREFLPPERPAPRP